MRVLLEFVGSHHYFKDFEKTVYYCMNCGQQSVWQGNNGGGDYYMGETLYCTACNCRMYEAGTPIILDPKRDGAYLSLIDQIRTGVCLEPTTKRGY